MTIQETRDITRIHALADLCYIDAYREIHTEEQNRFSFHEMYSTESLTHQLNDLHSRFFILEDQGEDRGYMAIYPLKEGVKSDERQSFRLKEEAEGWMLDKLYLRPDCKGMGYGRVLEQHVENQLRQLSSQPCRLVLKVNRRNAAVAFYQHLGFTITGQWDLPIADGRWIMDGYDMEKQV